MNSKTLKVLYLFAGERKKLEQLWQEGKMPDSFFIGLNHLKDLGIEATYIENKFLNWVRKKNYNLPNLFLLFTLRRYDIVFSGASLALPFVAKVLLRMKKPKFVWYNTFFTNAIRRNERKPFRLWAIKKSIASLDAVFCPSTAQRQFLIEQGFDPARIFFIPNGIDVAFMKWKQEEGKGAPRSAEPFILTVGKDMGRDYATLCEAVRGLPIKVKVAALPRNFKGVKDVPKNLEILGFVPFNDLIRLYNQAEFVVIPTKSETHLDASDCSGQYVLLDAMSLGKAVIASKRQTLADYLDDGEPSLCSELRRGEEGVVVPPEDPKALQAAILSLLRDKERAQALGRRAAERAETQFSTKRLAEELAKIFKGLLT